MRRRHLVIAILIMLVGSSNAPAQKSQSAVDYTNRALVRFAAGDFDAAIADLDIALAFDPNYAIAFFNRGTAQQLKQHLDEAIADYSRAVALDPKLAEAYNN